jgi:hypothetical protein
LGTLETGRISFSGLILPIGSNGYLMRLLATQINFKAKSGLKKQVLVGQVPSCCQP